MVDFNVVMQKEFKAGDEVYKKIAGLYEMNDDSIAEFYRSGDMLMVKRNGQIMEGLSYKGNNSFAGGGSGSNTRRVTFELKEGGDIKVKFEYYNAFAKKESTTEGIKTLKY
jgi:catechol 1,2-dioxygenase